MDQRVAVGRRLGNDIRADDAVGARAVINNDVLAQLPVELRRQPARDHIGAAAHGKGHDDAYRAIGKSLLRLCHARNQQCERAHCRATHGVYCVVNAFDYH